MAWRRGSDSCQGKKQNMTNYVYQELLKKTLNKNKNAVAIIVHGSSINGNLSNYSDIDINVFVSGKPRHVIENEIINYEGKKILVNLNFENYKDALNSMKKERNVDMILIYLSSYRKIKVLYDKINFIPQLIEAIKNKQKALRGLQINRIFINLNIMTDFYFKLMRARNKNDYLGMIRGAGTLANQSYRIISFFNKTDLDNIYSSGLNNFAAALKLKKAPKHFREDFSMCLGLKEKRNKKMTYNSGKRLFKETIDFIEKQNLNEIKNDEFFVLLRQAKELVK